MPDSVSITELELFILFFELDRLIYLLESRSETGTIPELSWKHAQAIIKELNKKREWALSQLSSFGVNPCQMGGKTITEEYRAWYQWWQDYLFGLSEEERLKIWATPKEFTNRPAGDWKTLIGTC
jgi:hypothetical protein